MQTPKKVLVTSCALAFSLGVATFGGVSSVHAAPLSGLSSNLDTDVNLSVQVDTKNQFQSNPIIQNMALTRLDGNLGLNANLEQKQISSCWTWSAGGGWTMQNGKFVWNKNGGFLVNESKVNGSLALNLGLDVGVNQRAGAWIWSNQGGWTMKEGKMIWSKSGGYIWVKSKVSNNVDLNLDVEADLESKQSNQNSANFVEYLFHKFFR